VQVQWLISNHLLTKSWKVLVGDNNKEFIQQKNERKIKNGERCRIHHGLDLHAAIKDEICQCLRQA